MSNYKKMYLVEPSVWQKMKAAQMNEHPPDISLNQLNEQLVKTKLMENKKKNEEWTEFGEKLTPIIRNSIPPPSIVKPIVPESSPPPPESPSPSTSRPPTDRVIEELNASVSPNYVTKATRLYNLLRELPEVKITPYSIFVDNEQLYGLTSTNLGQLVKGNKYLSFNLAKLIAKIAGHPEIEALISNQQAKESLRSYRESAKKRHMTSTPLKSAIEPSGEGDDMFFDPDSTLELNKTDKKGGKRPKLVWKSLF